MCAVKGCALPAELRTSWSGGTRTRDDIVSAITLDIRLGQLVVWSREGDSNSHEHRSERWASAELGYRCPKMVLPGRFDPPASEIPTRCSAE